MTFSIRYRLGDSIAKGDVAGVRQILKDNPELLNERIRDDDGTWIHLAVHNSQPEVVRALIELGVDPNLENELNRSPLWLAASGYHSFATTQVLLELGANPDTHVDDEHLLHVVINDPNILSLLLRHGANVNVFDCMSCTPLYYAVYYKYRDSALMLLEYGADPDARADTKSRSTLEEATLIKRHDIVDFINAWHLSKQAHSVIAASSGMDGISGLKPLAFGVCP